VFQRFAGIDGPPFSSADFGMTALASAISLCFDPFRRRFPAGRHIGYLKFTPERDVEPVLAGAVPALLLDLDRLAAGTRPPV